MPGAHAQLRRITRKRRGRDPIKAYEFNDLVRAVRSHSNPSAKNAAGMVVDRAGVQMRQHLRGAGISGAASIVRISVAPDTNGKMLVVLQAVTVVAGALVYADEGDVLDAYADPAGDACNADADGSYGDLYDANKKYWAFQVGEALMVHSGGAVVGYTADPKYIPAVYVDADTGCFTGVSCRRHNMRAGIVTATESTSGCLVEE